MQCQKCGAAINRGASFCGACGAQTGFTVSPGIVASRQSGNVVAWAVAVIAVGLLGAAIAYILLDRSNDKAAAVAATETTPANAKPTELADVAAAGAGAGAGAAKQAVIPDAPVAQVVNERRAARETLGSYRAFIGNADLYASDGLRLTRPWQILRQDRANVHRFGIRDGGDEIDVFFGSANNRANMERMVMAGTIEPLAARRIVAGGVFVRVEVYGSGARGDRIAVTVE